MVALILTRTHIDSAERLLTLFDTLCYQPTEGTVQQPEVQYISSLVFRFLSQVCDQKLSHSILDPLLAQVFTSTSQQASLQSLVVVLNKNAEVQHALRLCNLSL